MEYVTKDSGERVQFDGGMTRDTNSGKPRFDLTMPEGVPYNEQLITRFARLMARGAIKYNARNWEKAEGKEEFDRFKESAFRHFMQWYCDETDEDHAVAVLFNIMGAETVSYKLKNTSLYDSIEKAKKELHI